MRHRHRRDQHPGERGQALAQGIEARELGLRITSALDFRV